MGKRGRGKEVTGQELDELGKIFRRRVVGCQVPCRVTGVRRVARTGGAGNLIQQVGAMAPLYLGVLYRRHSLFTYIRDVIKSCKSTSIGFVLGVHQTFKDLLTLFLALFFGKVDSKGLILSQFWLCS